MIASQYDVVVVGAGCAGLTAAVGLARAGFTVAVVESATASGLGGVCFAENLAQPEILGAEGVEALAWERRLIERGSFVTDGRRLLGTTYRDADAFPHCYVVLRSRFNAHLAQVARTHGVVLLTETTVESLIREGRRIVGVATSRGPLYGDLVFLAEGDAGHLVSRERLDRCNDPRDTPSFLYCLQQIVDVPPGAVEECFRVGPEEGVAYELLLRNPGGTPLNARGFVCTNRQSVTLSVVVSMENLRRHFDGEPRGLLDWFADMPALRPWWREGKRGAWTARLLRSGGLRDVPYLAEDGLAVGGAAAGLGIDFPVLNTIGPATLTGLLLARAAGRIRADGGDFNREQLVSHYVEPLRQTRSWRDVEFLQRWPGYVRRTRVLFDGELDLLLDSAAVWSKPRRWLPRKLWAWFRLLGRVRWAEWSALRDDLFRAGHALRFRDITTRPALARVVLDGALNAFRDLVRKPRPHLPSAGTLRIHYLSADDNGSVKTTPVLLRRWFGRFQPVLASLGRILYRNDDTALSVRMTAMIELLVRQVNLIDLFALAALGSLTAVASTLLGVCGSVFRQLWRRRTEENKETGKQREKDKKNVNNLFLSVPGTVPLIHIVWRSTHPHQRADAVRDLPRVCPAGVFEMRGEPPDAVQVMVYGERCIRCEACWRSNPSVDWGRNFPSGGRQPPERSTQGADAPRSESWSLNPILPRLLDQLDGKLSEFEESLANEPATIDRSRSDYLEMLARYAQQLAVHVRDVLHESDGPIWQQALEWAAAIVAKTEERARRVWDGRFAWAVADGRLLRQHHLANLRRVLGLDVFINPQRQQGQPLLALRVGAISREDACVKHLLADIAARRYLLETLEQFPLPAAETVNAALLAALAVEVREGLTAKTAELHALHDNRSAEWPTRSASRGADMTPPVDLGSLRALLDVPGDWQTLIQRRALSAEREEILKAEERLLALASNCPPETTDEADVRDGFARQAAHVLAGKLLLLRTHERLENGLDAELATVLLRVWLDYAATRLDEFTIVVRDRLRPSTRDGDRPLVEFGSGSPPRTTAEYLAAPSPYVSGDFLLAPVDLLQPRLVPEMVSSPEEITAVPELAHATADLRDRLEGWPRREEILYLAEALTVEITGRRAHPQTHDLDLETACARLIVTELYPRGNALSERCVILRELTEKVLPRWQRGGEARVRHLGRDVLELEALKADFRRRLLAAGDVFGAALGRNADVQASCFALAEAAAWLKAADSVLGRMAWLSRVSETDERETLGRRVLAHCLAEVRDRLFRFDEDLASLRRGYYVPHVRAAALLRGNHG